SVPAIGCVTASGRTVLMLLPSPSPCPVAREPGVIVLWCRRGARWADRADGKAAGVVPATVRCHRPVWLFVMPCMRTPLLPRRSGPGQQQQALGQTCLPNPNMLWPAGDDPT